MSTKEILFYREKKEISVNFYPTYGIKNLLLILDEDQLKQRVFMMMLGYEDANDVTHL